MATPNPMPVSFHGNTLYVLDHQGEPFVPMRPVVEGMGLDWKAQYDKLRGSRFASCVGEITTQAPGDSQRRKYISLPLRKLPGWLMSIHPNKVKAGIRDKVIQFQNECDDVLWQHWQKRHPDATPMIKPESHPEDSQWVEGHFGGQRIRCLVGFRGWEVCVEDCAQALGYRSAVDLFKLTPGGMHRQLPPSLTDPREADTITLVRPTALLSALVRSQRAAAPALADYLEREIFTHGAIAAEFTPTRADKDYARQLFEEDPAAFLGDKVWLLRADPDGGLMARALREGETIMDVKELDHVKRAYDTLEQFIHGREPGRASSLKSR